MSELYRRGDIGLDDYDIGTHFELWRTELDPRPIPDEEEKLSTPKRVLAALGAMVLVAGGVGYEAGHPEEDAYQVSADQIANDLNSDGTAKPVLIEHNSKLVIPKDRPTDTPLALVEPIRLSNDTYGTVVFEEKKKDKKCEADVVEVPAEAELEPIENANGEEAEQSAVVYPISVVYTEVTTKSGEKEVVCSLVMGDESGNAANVVRINERNANAEQKKLLKDKEFRGLVKDVLGFTQDRVAYIEIAS